MKIMKLFLGCVVVGMVIGCGKSTNKTNTNRSDRTHWVSGDKLVEDGHVILRLLTIPDRDGGYSHFDSIVITSKDDLGSFKKRLHPDNTSKHRWSNWDVFEKSIDDAAIDFDKEALVLIRQTIGSSSIGVFFSPPEVQGRTVICNVDLDVPQPRTGEMLFGDMVFYCSAMVIDKTRITEVEQRSSGKKIGVLHVQTGLAANELSGASNAWK